MEYRVKEFNGVYRIEVLVTKEKGLLWWKKKESRWHSTNIHGKPLDRWLPPSRSFVSLQDVQDRVKLWKKGPDYHKVT